MKSDVGLHEDIALTMLMELSLKLKDAGLRDCRVEHLLGGLAKLRAGRYSVFYSQESRKFAVVSKDYYLGYTDDLSQAEDLILRDRRERRRWWISVGLFTLALFVLGLWR